MPTKRVTKRQTRRPAFTSEAMKKAMRKETNVVLARRGIRPELKCFEVITTDATVDTNTFEIDMVNVAQGDQPYERNGNRILVKKLEVCYVVTAVGGVPGNLYHNFGAGILIDKQPNGASPLELIAEPNASLLASEAPYTGLLTATGYPYATIFMKNMWMTKRYRHLMLRDGNIAVQTTWNYSSGSQPTGTNPLITTFSSPVHLGMGTKTFRFTRVFKKPVEVVYNDSTGVITSVQSNNFLFCLFPGQDEKFSVTVHHRIIYTDV